MRNKLGLIGLVLLIPFVLWSQTAEEIRSDDANLFTNTEFEVMRTFVLFYLDQDQLEEAKKAVERFLRKYPDSKAALGILNRFEDSSQATLDRLQRSFKYSFYFESIGGWSSNALLLSDSTLDSIASSNSEAALSRSRADIRLRWEAPYQSTSLVNIVRFEHYFSDEAKGLGQIGGGFLMDHRRNPKAQNSWGLKPALFYSFTQDNNYDAYLMMPELVPYFRYKWSNRHISFIEPAIRYNWFPNESNSNPEDDRSGLSTGIDLRHQLRFSRYFMQIGAAYEHQFAKGDNFKSHRIGLPLRLAVKLPKSVEAQLSFSYRYVDYYDSSSDRKDHLLTPSFDMTWQAWKNFNLKAEYSFLRNQSSESENKYNRHEVGGGISYEF